MWRRLLHESRDLRLDVGETYAWSLRVDLVQMFELEHWAGISMRDTPPCSASRTSASTDRQQLPLRRGRQTVADRSVATRFGVPDGS